MNYQVLARKWRPHCFEEMVGQRHVLQALSNALESDRLHHAYLFTGTRGVGKTTIARIFAKSLNCEQGVSAKPCGQCSVCKEIDEGRFVDLIEVDAASRTGVDDTRDLLDNVQYAPTRGRYKVYLIDEVHMFSKSSFNALLKTLEEPPPNIKFLLATTDPKQIPPTVLSRCLQFNLKRITAEQIEAQLAHILEQEKIGADPRSLEMIAFAADGSLRDSLSLLDQAISFTGGELKADEVASMLGTIDRDQVLDLLELLARKEAAAVIEKADQLKELGPDYQVILAELLVLLQAVAVKQLVPQSYRDQRDNARLEDIAALLTAEECQLYYQIALKGQADLNFHPEPASGFTMILLRILAFHQQALATEPKAVKKSQLEVDNRQAMPVTNEATESKPKGTSESPEMTNAVAPIVESEQEPQRAPHAPLPKLQAENWHQILEHLDLLGLPKQLALNCAMETYEDGEFRLLISPGAMRTKRMEQQLETALRERIDDKLRLVISEQDLEQQETPLAKQNREDGQRLEQAQQVIKSDTNVQAICDAFDATIIEDSIRSLEPSDKK